MKTEELINAESQVHLGTYARFPIVLSKGRGSKLWDVDGKEYTDFLSGIGVVNLGHGAPAVIEAFCAQAAELVHACNLFYTTPQIALAAKLAARAQAKCFFANSGAEANEGAMKLARLWGKRRFGPEKSGFVTALNSFHGRTLATLTATGQPAKQEPFAPLPPGFKHVPHNDIKALEAAVDGTICAVMLEVVQGESGVWPTDREYLRAVRALCDERDVLLIFDEVQAGMGRTGKFFSFEHYDVWPDIITLAKGLANGLPIGAILARGGAADLFQPGEHGSTFGGGPAVCAAAVAVLETIEKEGVLDRAARLGVYFKDRLSGLAATTSLITDLRGLGLMLGMSLGKPVAREVVLALLERGFIVNNVGDYILRFLPPLIITESEIDALITALEAVLSDSGKDNG